MRLYYTRADNVQSCMLKNTPQNIQFKKHGFGQQEELCMDNGSYMKTRFRIPIFVEYMITPTVSILTEIRAGNYKS
jgi:hypothetical protein